MSQLRGKCVICTSILTSDDIAALRCGHTFHFPCISEWIKRSDTCPICREWTAQCLMVKHLYFDCADDPNASQVEVPSAVQVESLSMALAQEKNKHAQAAEEVTRLKSLVDKLKEELAAAKKSYENETLILDAWCCLRQRHEQTQNQLRACESQLDEARKTEQKLKDELKVERESVSALKKEEHELKNKVATLEKELREVRGTAITGSTPSNPNPRSLALDQRPSPENIRYHLRSRCVLKSDRPTGSGAVQGAAPKALTSLEKRDGSTDVISRKPGLKQRLNQNNLAHRRPSLSSKKSSF